MPQPTTRILAVLELLQSQAQIGGAELARRVNVDRRTLRRYIATLEEMGIPITTEQGRYGGYRLVPGYKLPPMMFTDEEAQALSLGLIAARGLGLADAAPAIESVQAKLDRMLPGAPRRTVSACDRDRGAAAYRPRMRETRALPDAGTSRAVRRGRAAARLRGRPRLVRTGAHAPAFPLRRALTGGAAPRGGPHCWRHRSPACGGRAAVSESL
jgi:predicted DNA-binding transcriptional regulator YafY